MAQASRNMLPRRPPIITWTRFYLPREQEWPTWSVDGDDIYAGPFGEVEGYRNLSLGRLVDDPEQAAYIVVWNTLDDLKAFQSSAACAEFLQNLPKHEISLTSINAGEALKHLTLDDNTSTSSRFMTLQYDSQVASSPIEGRLILTTLVVPDKAGENGFRGVERTFIPSNIDSVPGGRFSIPGVRFWHQRNEAVWFWVLTEDKWVEEKFGKPRQTQEDYQPRSIYCHFSIRPRRADDLRLKIKIKEDPEADLRAREIGKQHITHVVPPAIAWEQEFWEIREVPRFVYEEPDIETDSDDMDIVSETA